MAVAQSPTSSPLGAAIRERRRQLGLTQEQLAERVGDSVTQSDISRIERGTVALPRRQRLEQLAQALDLSLGDLLVRSNWMDLGSDTLPSTGLPDAGDRTAALYGDMVDPVLHDYLRDIEMRLDIMANDIATTQQAVRTALRKLRAPGAGEVRLPVGVVKQWETNGPLIA